MTTTFKLRKVPSDPFRFILRPYADVIFYGKNGKARKITLIVDTGADFTILPRREAVLLGIDLAKDCERYTLYGVGGEQKVHVYKHLRMELGGNKCLVPVGFLNTNDVPPLLGRHHCLEYFKTSFNHWKEVSFKDHQSIDITSDFLIDDV